MTCWKCQKEIPEGSNYCGYCGTKLHKSESMMEYTSRVLAGRRAKKTTVRRKAVGGNLM